MKGAVGEIREEIRNLSYVKAMRVLETSGLLGELFPNPNHGLSFIGSFIVSMTVSVLDNVKLDSRPRVKEEMRRMIENRVDRSFQEVTQILDGVESEKFKDGKMKYERIY